MMISDRALTVFVYTSLSAILLVTIYPLIYVLFASVSDGDLLLAHTGAIWKPLGFNLLAYERVLANRALFTGFANTLFIVVVGTAVNVMMTILAAYVMSRKQMLWGPYLMAFILLPMFMNGGIIPFYLVVKGLGLINSLWSLIIPFAMKTFYFIIMRTAFQSLPPSLEESAHIDGAGHLTMLFRIIVPLSMPVIAVVTLYTCIDKWNMWFYPSLFIKDRTLYPIQLVLREILINNVTDSLAAGAGSGQVRKIGETIKYATIMIATFPVLLIYPFLQKHFVKGVMIGAIKG
ncbi:carbohydrate ABC transporter permease [Paenibacillus sp. SI8]|uniref:carbohydrate ABC transporter permease n=1 Tax=unclassified Paenibacillus TaxID=185978 RepID=UPI0034664223